MAYKRRYRRKGRSGSGLGGAVNDAGTLASMFGPQGALITGVIGFAFFYWLVPALLVAWANHNKAKMTGATAEAMGQVIDVVFLKRFINPSEWAGIAILILCVVIACWKAFTRTDLDHDSRRDVGLLARLLARFLD